MRIQATLTFIFLLTLTPIFHSQSLELINPVTTVTGTLAQIGTTGELEASWSVRNISDSTNTVRAKRVVQSAVAGSTNYFCWGVCFQETTDVSPLGVSVPMAAGTINTSFYAHYRPNGNAGQTAIQYCFFNRYDETDQVCNTVYFCVDQQCVLSAEELSMQNHQLGEFYPNPASGLTTIQYQHKQSDLEGLNIEIYDQSGRLVKSSPLNTQSGVVLFDTHELESGAYVCMIKSRSQYLGVRPLVVVH